MRTRRRIANALINGCGLWRLHDSLAQKLIRSVLDEIDVQHLKNTQPCPAFDDRQGMYEYLNANIVKAEAIEYLEFGVFRGESIRAWMSLNQNRDSRFYGFDSFEGLPETWREGQGPGHFHVGGIPPQVEDSRVQFIKGWFDDTVPPFFRTFSSRRRLVVHLDADLYSSTMVALTHLGPFLAAGSLLIFDEFYDRDHEFKAFRDFIRMSRKEYRIICQTEHYGKACIEVL